jgi:hypothetical protein
MILKQKMKKQPVAMKGPAKRIVHQVKKVADQKFLSVSFLANK